MLYALLCYHDEDVVNAWTEQEDDAVLARRAHVTDPLAVRGRMGPAARLMSTAAAVTVRSGTEPIVIDGPFAETKEQLLGFYVIECATLDEAVQVARDLGQGETGAFEIRPLRLFLPGTIPQREPQ